MLVSLGTNRIFVILSCQFTFFPPPPPPPSSFVGSSESISSPQLELWQFLLELLLLSKNPTILHWTDNEFEFQITNPTEVSQLWGQFTRTSGMNCKQLFSRLSSSHLTDGYIQLVQGREWTFKFDGQVKDYVRLRCNPTPNSIQQDEETELVVVVE